MSIIYLLIGISLLMAGGFLGAFFWAMGNGQNDDLYSPSIRVLFDNNTDTKNTNQNKQAANT